MPQAFHYYPLRPMAAPLQVDVADLVRAPGSSRRIEIELSLDVPGAVGVTVSGRLDVLSDGIWLEAAIAGTYRLECVRCLAPVEIPFSQEVGEMFRPGIPDGSDEGYPLRKDSIDLEPLARDAVILGTPLHPLCREQCAGLCAHCGADQNVAPCGCRREEGHPAFAGLARLFEEK